MPAETRAADDDAIIGIDLGTTNSEVAIISGGKPTIVEEGGEAILPSCVGLDDAGAVIVGRHPGLRPVAATLRGRRTAPAPDCTPLDGRGRLDHRRPCGARGRLRSAAHRGDARPAPGRLEGARHARGVRQQAAPAREERRDHAPLDAARADARGRTARGRHGAAVRAARPEDARRVPSRDAGPGGSPERVRPPSAPSARHRTGDAETPGAAAGAGAAREAAARAMRQPDSSDVIDRRWVQLALQYFHDLPASAGKKVADDDITADADGITVKIKEESYWVPWPNGSAETTGSTAGAGPRDKAPARAEANGPNFRSRSSGSGPSTCADRRRWAAPRRARDGPGQRRKDQPSEDVERDRVLRKAVQSRRASLRSGGRTRAWRSNARVAVTKLRGSEPESPPHEFVYRRASGRDPSSGLQARCTGAATLNHAAGAAVRGSGCITAGVGAAGSPDRTIGAGEHAATRGLDAHRARPGSLEAPPWTTSAAA